MLLSIILGIGIAVTGELMDFEYKGFTYQAPIVLIVLRHLFTFKRRDIVSIYRKAFDKEVKRYTRLVLKSVKAGAKQGLDNGYIKIKSLDIAKAVLNNLKNIDHVRFDGPADQVIGPYVEWVIKP